MSSAHSGVVTDFDDSSATASFNDMVVTLKGEASTIKCVCRRPAAKLKDKPDIKKCPRERKALPKYP